MVKEAKQCWWSVVLAISGFASYARSGWDAKTFTLLGYIIHLIIFKTLAVYTRRSIMLFFPQVYI